MDAMTIEPIPAFTDNYIWLIQTSSGSTYVIDPGDAGPVLSLLEERNLSLDGILITHWHPDHTGGIQTLKTETGCAVWGPDNPSIEGIDYPVSDGEIVALDNLRFAVMAVPGHTLDHIAYFGEGVLFCGDTLFVAGCGRVFEGTFPMMRASLERIRALPPETRIYCTHEYTASNLKFALAVDPDNHALKQQEATCRQYRQENRPTVPSTLSQERASNPFLRWDDPAIITSLLKHEKLLGTSPDEVFEALRGWKDNF
jgi:hydroxyacylglutathione hydrolase